MKSIHIHDSPISIKTVIILLAMLSLPSVAFSQSKKSDSFFSKGVALYNQGKYREAIICFEKVVDIDKKEIPQDSERSGYGIAWLASCHYKLGDIKKAQEILPYNYQFEPMDRRLTIESDKEADMANQCQQKGNIKEAVRHATKCLYLEQSALGQNSLHCVGSYLMIGDLYLQLGNNRTALENYNNGLSILDELNIKDSIIKFHLLMGKVYVHLSNNDIQTAFSEMKGLESISEHERNENADHYPAALVDLLYAKINIKNEDYEHTVTHAVNAFKCLLDQYKPNDEEKFSYIVECIKTLLMISRYEAAIPLLHDAIDKVSLNVGHQGIILSYLGDCTGDIDTYQKSIDLLSKSEYEDMYNSTKCMLAYIYERKGEELRAIDAYQEVCDYYIQSDTDSPTYRQALMSLGNAYEKQGDYSKAYDYYKQILGLMKNDKKDPDFILTFMKWIPIYAKYSVAAGSFDENNGFLEGYKMGEELKDIFTNIKINDFLNKGIGLSTIANIVLDFIQTFLQHAIIVPWISWQAVEKELTQLTYDYLIPRCSENEAIIIRAKAALAHTKYILGKYEESTLLMNEIISCCKRLGFPYDNYLHDLAYYQYDSGDKSAAYENFKIGYDFNKNNILSGYRWMTIDERDKLTRASRGNLYNMAHYAAITPEDSRYAELGYDVLLFTKGLLLNSTISLSRLLQEEGDINALNLLRKWRKNNQEYQIAQQQEDYIKVQNLKVQIDALERQLMDTSKLYGDYTNGLTVDFKEVQMCLEDGDMALEFFYYQNDAKTKMYGAIMLTKHTNPKYIPVGLDNEWTDLIGKCYDNEDLFNSLFANLKPYLPTKEKGCIYFAADGILHTVAIENLPGSESYDFRRLSSTREIVIHKEESAPLLDIALIGGVKYGIGKFEEYYKEEANVNRESLDFLLYLPGTRVEVDKIETLLSPKINVSKFIADKATEKNFKNFSGKKIGLLHIATHGFFDPPSNINNQAKYEAEAMKSSGLYFAGAQNTLWGEPEKNMKEDGILSAQEIANLDLRGLRLAVLSACETGKGSIGPDGVFGLQRGFKQAGADGIMMTLWKVDDKATQILMENFYKNLTVGQDQYIALRNAQDAVKKDYPDPKYWAAFILIDAIRELKFKQ